MFSKVKGLWKEFVMWHDEMQWQNSNERRELAAKRLAVYRKFMDGDPSHQRNPYEFPEDYDLY